MIEIIWVLAVRVIGLGLNGTPGKDIAVPACFALGNIAEPNRIPEGRKKLEVGRTRIITEMRDGSGRERGVCVDKGNRAVI